VSRVAGTAVLLALVLVGAGCSADEEPARTDPTGSPTDSAPNDASSTPPTPPSAGESDRSDTTSTAPPRKHHRRSDSPTGSAGDSGVIPDPSD
jgi:hypothetical protein